MKRDRDNEVGEGGRVGSGVEGIRELGIEKTFLSDSFKPGR